MKKTFPLQISGQDPKRVLELVRGEVGKYVNRERRKPLPLDFDRVFTCRIGADQATATTVDVKQVPHAIDDLAVLGATEAYVEIIAVTQPRPKPTPAADSPTE